MIATADARGGAAGSNRRARASSRAPCSRRSHRTCPASTIPRPTSSNSCRILYPPGTPQPTAAEVERESFVAKGFGQYTIGPGQFDTQTITIHGFGKPMTSNISRKMHFQFVVFEPTDPSQAVNGTINLVGGNYLQNSTDLILYLVGTDKLRGQRPADQPLLHDGRQLTQLDGVCRNGERSPCVYANFPANYFTASGNLAPPPGSPGSLGPPTSVDNWGMALGIATFKYIPDKHPEPGSLGSGTVIVELPGLRNTPAPRARTTSSTIKGQARAHSPSAPERQPAGRLLGSTAVMEESIGENRQPAESDAARRMRIGAERS